MSERSLHDERPALSERAGRALSLGATPWLPRLVGLGLALVFLVGQLAWMRANVTIAGHDAGAHLVRSVEIFEALRAPGRETVAAILGTSVYRPPLLYLLTAPFYALLGPSYDAALLANLICHLLTGLVLYALGRRLGGEWAGVLAGALTLFTPILFGLARLFYQEPLVTLLVWAGLWLLVEMEGGRRRRPAALFGVVVGLGLLAKWTTPAFLVAPLLWMLWQARGAWGSLSRPSWAQGGQALLVGGVLAGLWGWLVAPLVADPALLALLWLGWTLLFGVAFLALRAPTTQGWNLLLAGALALAVASLWYLPNLSFLGRFAVVAAGEESEAAAAATEALSLLTPAGWLFYLRALVWSHVGLFGMGALLAGVLALRGRWQGFGLRAVALTLALTLLIFTLTPFRVHARAIVPIVPAVALLTAVGLVGRSRTWPAPRWALLVAGGTLLAQVGQFVLLTDGVSPELGSAQGAGLVVSDPYLFAPAAGLTDPAYHIAPDLLPLLRADAPPGDRVELALLVNDAQLHQNTLRAEFEMMAPGTVRVIPLTKGEGPYPELFHTPFVLFKRGGSTDASPEAVAALARIEAEVEGLFGSAFETVRTWPTPSGETLVLARRRHALIPDSVRDQYAPILAHLQARLMPGDLGVVESAEQVNPLGALGWPETPLVTLDAGQRVETLGPRLTPGRRLFALLWNQAPETEPWLDGHLVRSEDWWFGDIHLIAYVVPSPSPAQRFPQVGRLDRLMLDEVAIDQPAPRPGDALTVALRWLPEQAQPATHRTVVQLYAADGSLIAMRDLPPEGEPWVAGEARVQRTALLLPREGWQGPACLIVARYEPADTRRLQTPEGADHLSLCPPGW